MLKFSLPYCYALMLSLTACSAPTPPVEANQPVVATPAYIWADSLPHYFPAEAAEMFAANRARKSHVYLLGSLDCAHEYRFAGQCLAAFHAPVLGNLPAGTAVYRFVWLRSFHPPALLTLERTATGGVLRTQFLNKEPGRTVPTLIDPNEPGIPDKERQRRQKFVQKMLADSQYLASIAFAKAPVKVFTLKDVTISKVQLRQFESIVARAGFWQLSSCLGPDGVFDGAYWFLEAQAASQYHVVFRHSPEEQEGFRRCCEFLLDLSPARKEERY